MDPLVVMPGRVLTSLYLSRLSLHQGLAGRVGEGEGERWGGGLGGGRRCSSPWFTLVSAMGVVFPAHWDDLFGFGVGIC